MCTAGYHPLRTPLAIDNQTFFYIAERAASGVPPHVSVVNHKQALAHLLEAAAIAAGRALGVDDVYAARALSIAATAALVAGTCKLAQVLTASAAAAALSGLAMLTFSGLLRQGVMGFRPQLFATFFLVSALLAFARGRNARAGAYGASAFLCWQPAAAALAGVLGAAAFGSRAPARMAKIAGGAAAVLAIYEAYFTWTGALGAQLFQTWVMAAYGASNGMPWVTQSLFFLVWATPRAGMATAIVPAALFAAGALWAWRWRREPPAVARLWRERGVVRAVVLTAALALAATFVNHQAYPDKFFLMPFMAISAGWLALRSAALVPARAARPALLCVYALLLGLLVVRAVRDYPIAGDALGRQRALAAEATALAQRDSSLWALGCLHLLALERRDNYTPIGILIDERVRRYAHALYAELRPDPMPQVILLARLDREYRPAWLAREYSDRTPAAFAREGVGVWIRR